MVVSLITATAVASKWILAGKIMLAVGGGVITSSPILNPIIKKKKNKST